MNDFALGFRFEHVAKILLLVAFYYFGDWLIKGAFIKTYAQFVRAQMRMGPLLSIVGYSSLPRLLFVSLAMVIDVSFGKPLYITPWFTNVILGRTLENSMVGSPVFYAVLQQIQPFSLWSLLLTAMGIKYLFKSRILLGVYLAACCWLLTGVAFFVIETIIDKIY
jgi:hypothetical protein